MRRSDLGNPFDQPLVDATAKIAQPFVSPAELAPLVAALAPAKVVMLGESSHGTHEFYDLRREISRRLVRDHGFSFIAVEGDWPPCWALNEYVRGRGPARNAREALRAFTRWPTWMWANEEVIQLAEELRAGPSAGFYGLDVYSLFDSIAAAVDQVSRLSPFLARRMKARYACFEPFLGDELAYAKSLLRFPEGCHDQVVRNLEELLAERLSSLPDSADPAFDAEQNARVVANAENYYRTMVHGNEDSWNVRDRHMHETLTHLLERHGPHAKAIVWAHNTHIGDYRATDMQARGQINIGGLARETWGEENVALVGFGTYGGQVIAGRAWDGPMEEMVVPNGKPGSFEAAFHKVATRLRHPNFWIPLRDQPNEELRQTRGHRAIGVVYHPESELFGNYVPTSLSRRYDAFVFCDETRALAPLRQGFHRMELPETYPQGY